MKDDPELQINDDWEDDKPYAPKRRRIGEGSTKLFRMLLAVLLLVVFAGGIFYFITKRTASDESKPVDSKLTALEQKVANLEKQLGDLQGKMGAAGTDPVLAQRVEGLLQRVDALEKRPRPTVESVKPAPPKSVATTEKQYHTVQKGETLTKISKKYGTTVEELRKLNHLSPDQNPRAGQKLLVSTGRSS